MSEIAYPIACQSCRHTLFGPVSYCPYCGTPDAVPLAAKKAEESQHATKQDPGRESACAEPRVESSETTPPDSAHEAAPEKKRPEKLSRLVTEPKPEEPKPEEPKPEEPKAEELKAEELKAEEPKAVEPKAVEPKGVKPQSEGVQAPNPPKPRKIPWAVVAVVFVVAIVGYLASHKKGEASLELPAAEQASAPDAPGQGGKESARIAAMDALRAGTDLSVNISRLPQLEKVLKAAKSLGEISPRYQEQITSAESTLNSAQKQRDKNLMSYLGKVLDLGRYSQEQISYSMGLIQNGDLTQREKVVAELLAKHVAAAGKSSKGDSAALLADFTGRFSNFVD